MGTVLSSPSLPSTSGSCASQGSQPTGVSSWSLSLLAGDCGEGGSRSAVLNDLQHLVHTAGG